MSEDAKDGGRAASCLSPPGLSWVRFLRNYGPIPTNGNLFDEHVSKALSRAKVQPISLPTPRLAEMERHFQDGLSGSILVAGTAGDGKTYHLRSLWNNLGGAPSKWSSPAPVKDLIVGHRRVVFVKDLSELGGAEGDEVLEGLERSVASDDGVSYVVATNHGQILDRLRRRGEHLHRVSPLRDPIQTAFLDPGASHPRLRIFDLSRAAKRSSMEEVLMAVASHPEWARCARCPLDTDGKRCPISENRSRVHGSEDGGLFRRRLGDLVELSRLNGAHLPVRDLLALAANVLLGHPDAKEGLMTCSDIDKIQQDGREDRASLYRNVFGANLSRRRALTRPVFRTLSLFGVGEETANGVDGLLVYGSDDICLKETFARLVASDRLYGASPGYLAAQRCYLEGGEGAREDDGEESFLERLADQRRRLFFSLPADPGGPYQHWGLTSFAHAGDFMSLTDATEAKKVVDEGARSRIVRGLNRVITGLLIENADRVFVAGSGGSANARVGTLCDTEVPARKTQGVGLSIRFDKTTQRPCIDVVVAKGTTAVLLDLTPIRFEFLCRVADGALPSSFSNECLEDLLAFKVRLLRQVEAARRLNAEDAEEEVQEDSGSLDLSFIEINNNDGHGALRRMTVRVPA